MHGLRHVLSGNVAVWSVLAPFPSIPKRAAIGLNSSKFSQNWSWAIMLTVAKLWKGCLCFWEVWFVFLFVKLIWNNASVSLTERKDICLPSFSCVFDQSVVSVWMPRCQRIVFSELGQSSTGATYVYGAWLPIYVPSDDFLIIILLLIKTLSQDLLEITNNIKS